MKTIDQIIVKAVEQRLKKFKGNKTHTSKSLGVSIRTLRNWVLNYPELSKYHVTRHGYESRGKTNG